MGGCSSGTAVKPQQANRYFSLKDYFSAEVSRLAALQPIVEKTVKNNGKSSVQTSAISDWRNELALFANADINKPSWRDAYRIDSAESSISYTATSPDLTIREIVIHRSADAISGIKISKRSSNYLYSFSESLHYFPDSAYHINRTQNVWLLGNDSSGVEVIF